MRNAINLRLGALALLAGLVAAAWLAFSATGADYQAFWLKSGPVIGLATGAFGWAWGKMDRNAGLISANPVIYCGAAMQVAGLPLIAFGGHLRRSNHLRDLSTRDLLLTVPMAVLLALAVIGWLILIAPAQYFAFLIFGAPSRIALSSRHRVHARMQNGRLEVAEHIVVDDDRPNKDDGWWDASMRDRPVTVAGAFMAAGLIVIDTIAG